MRIFKSNLSLDLLTQELTSFQTNNEFIDPLINCSIFFLNLFQSWNGKLENRFVEFDQDYVVNDPETISDKLTV